MDDLSLSARIAIGLIVISVVIMVIFNILGFTRNITNQGLNSFQNAMNQVSLSQFDDYDQKPMGGATVLSAVKALDGNGSAVMIQTAKRRGSNSYDPGKGSYVNYGALASGHTSFIHSSLKRDSESDSWYTMNLLAGSNKKFNLNYKGLYEQGGMDYIRPNAKFYAEKILDDTGEIVGVAFTQF